MAVNADIFDERDDWRGPLAVSVALHGFLIAAMFLYAFFIGRDSGQTWGGTGGGGEAMSATLVNSVPLPAKPESTNVLANESKGLTESQPKPKVEEPDAIPIPDKTTKIKPSKKPLTPTPTKPQEVAKVDNRVPFGEGGPVAGPYSTFSIGNSKGGFGFNNGAGDFGSRFAYYVDGIRRKISDNWMRYGLDPNIAPGRRVYVTFEIKRDGSVNPNSVKVEQSSNIPSLDNSAILTLKRIDTFGPLPAGYNGNSVNVEFWFEK